MTAFNAIGVFGDWICCIGMRMVHELFIFYYLQTRAERAYGSLNCLRFTANDAESENQIIEKALLDF